MEQKGEQLMLSRSFWSVLQGGQTIWILPRLNMRQLGGGDCQLQRGRMTCLGTERRRRIASPLLRDSRWVLLPSSLTQKGLLCPSTELGRTIARKTTASTRRSAVETPVLRIPAPGLKQFISLMRLLSGKRRTDRLPLQGGPSTSWRVPRQRAQLGSPCLQLQELFCRW